MKTVLLSLAIPIAVVAAIHGAPDRQPAGPIEPGDPRVHFVMPAREPLDFRITAITDTALEPRGGLRETLEAVTVGGVALVVKSTAETDGDPPLFVDSLFMRPATLEPVRYVSDGASGHRDLEFERNGGTVVRGTLRSPEGRTTAVEYRLDHPAFAGQAFFTVLRSLPFDRESAFSVRFFRVPDHRELIVRYQSLGVDTLTDRSGRRTAALRVSGQIDQSIALYWLDARTHALIKVVSFGPGGRESWLAPATSP